MYTAQELIDRLVVATEEQDVLYVVYWLKEMKRFGGSLDETVNVNHTWKAYSALDSIARLSTLSTLHKGIAQLLLLSGARPVESEPAQGRKTELETLLFDWCGSERSKPAYEARHLLSLDLEEAATRIDENLPVPPNPDKLTGDASLPPPLDPLLPLSPPQLIPPQAVTQVDGLECSRKPSENLESLVVSKTATSPSELLLPRFPSESVDSSLFSFGDSTDGSEQQNSRVPLETEKAALDPSQVTKPAMSTVVRPPSRPRESQVRTSLKYSRLPSAFGSAPHSLLPPASHSSPSLPLSREFPTALRTKLLGYR